MALLDKLCCGDGRRMQQHPVTQVIAGHHNPAPLRPLADSLRFGLQCTSAVSAPTSERWRLLLRSQPSNLVALSSFSFSRPSERMEGCKGKMTQPFDYGEYLRRVAAYHEVAAARPEQPRATRDPTLDALVASLQHTPAPPGSIQVVRRWWSFAKVAVGL